MDDAARDLARVVRHLVEQPDAVRVREQAPRGGGPGARYHVLDLEVAAEDMGSVIGRGGRTAQALRALLRHRGDVLGISYDLKIREPGESPGRQERG